MKFSDIKIEKIFDRKMEGLKMQLEATINCEKNK